MKKKKKNFNGFQRKQQRKSDHRMITPTKEENRFMEKNGFIAYLSSIGLILLVSVMILLSAGNTFHENKDLYTKNDSLQNVISELQKENNNLKFHYRAFYVEKSVYSVSVTGYHPVPEQTDNTPDITADGTQFEIDRAGEYRFVALSRDMIKRWGGPFVYGDLIYIHGLGKIDANGIYHPSIYDGIYQVRDTMHPRHKNWVDVLLTPGDRSFYEKNILMRKVNVIHEYAFSDVFGSIKSPFGSIKNPM